MLLNQETMMKLLLSVFTVVFQVVFKGRGNAESEAQVRDRDRRREEAERRLDELTSRVEAVQRDYAAERYDR